MKTLFLLFALAYSLSCLSQDVKTTLSTANHFIAAKQLARADSVLAAYNRAHTNAYVLQLHAQVMYWKQDYPAALDMYEKALTLFPDSMFLHLDYGRFLFHTGKLSTAERQLLRVTSSDKTHAEANMMLAQLASWKGNVAKATAHLRHLQEAYPTNNSIAALAKEICSVSAPFVRVAYDYLSDDQPLTGSQATLDAGFTQSSYFAPHLSANGFQYTSGNIISKGGLFKIGNTFRFGYGSTTIRADGGMFMPAGTATFIGSAELTQKLSRNVNVQLGTARLPYQYTVSSLRQPFAYGLTTAALNYNRKDKILGKAAIEVQGFDDGNMVYTGYSWLLLPVIHQAKLKLKSGYSFSYADSRINSFSSKVSLPVLAATQPFSTSIGGVYQTVFTPRKQAVHSLLLSSSVDISNVFQLSLTGSLGLSASADNPVLILEKNAAGQAIINKYYYKQKYTPVELSAILKTQLSPGVSLNTKYTYSSLFFYTRNNFNLQLNYLFLHGK